MVTLSEVLSLFPYINKTKNGCNTECPLHDDQIGSLSVAQIVNRKGFDQIVFHCQAGCLGKRNAPDPAAYNALLKILGYTKWDLTSEPRPVNNGNGNASKYAHLLEDIIAVHDYKDEAGKLLYQCVRYDTKAQKAKGRQPAKCRMRQPGKAPGYYKWNLDNVRLILYRLPELLASDPVDYVFIFEGEKDVDNAKKRGLIATCNPTGAQSWTDNYSAFLANRTCFIVPDNDSPGALHANQVYDSLLRCAPGATVKILALQGLKAKGDVSDWFDEGHTADELKALADALLVQSAPSQAPPVQPPPASGPNPAPAPIQKIYNTTDMGNAERFVDRFGNDLRYCSKLGKDGTWLIWDGMRWQLDERLRIHKLAKEIVPTIYAEAQNAILRADKERLFKWALDTESLSTRNNMVKDARPSLAISVDDLDKHAWLLNCKNGTLDLRTGKLKPHVQSDYLSKLVNFDYDENALCPEWDNYLIQTQQNKTEIIRYIQKAIGYTLAGDVSEKCMFVLHGPPDTGKSTFIEMIQILIEEYSTKIQTQTLMFQRDRGIPNDIAKLKGTRFVHASEAEEQERLAESRIKELTGGDTVCGCFKYGEEFHFAPTWTIWLSTNNKPKVSGDKALWNRLKLIPFTRIFTKAEQDKKLRAKLIAEMPGILRWAVEGCLLWQKEGLGEPADVAGATGKYKDEQDILGHFIDQQCELDTDYTEMAADLYKTYRQWCQDAGEYAQSQRWFGLKLEERGFVGEKRTSDPMKGRVEYSGIRLIPDQNSMGF